MNKSSSIFISIVALMIIWALSTTAWFTDSETTGTYAFTSGILDVDMDCTDTGGNTPFALFAVDDTHWVPGDFRATIITIKNSGTLDARWRMGIVPNVDSSDILLDKDEIVLSFYSKDDNGNWQLIRSDYIEDFMVNNDEDNWIYDKDLTGAEEFTALAAGESQDMLLVVDFELSAQAPVQGEEFTGKIILQGAQVSVDEWFPSAEITLDIEGGEI